MNMPRHAIWVRVTHWVNTVSFFALLVSGVAILLAHPRLYWGEAGGVGSPSLVDLPLPFVLVGQTGWGRYLHFLGAWALVLNGLLYVVSGFTAKHFSRGFDEYNLWQRAAYSAVIFVLAPLITLTGLAMSPAIASVVPGLVMGFGGQQSARTIHFAVASLFVLFFLGHVAMVYRAGFVPSLRSMIRSEA